MRLVSTPQGMRRPLEDLIPDTRGRMEPVKDPDTGMITMVQQDDMPMTDEMIVYHLSHDMYGYSQNTPHADDADIDELLSLIERTISTKLGSVPDLFVPARAVMLRLAENGHPYPYAERLTQALDAVAPESNDHDHDHGGVCPLCPSQDMLDEMRERNERNATDKRQALLAEIAASPASFVHIVEGYDISSPKETIVMRVCSTLELATAYCTDGNLSVGVVYEIIPTRIDGDGQDGNVVISHFHLQDGVVQQAEGRWYPRQDDEA